MRSAATLEQLLLKHVCGRSSSRRSVSDDGLQGSRASAPVASMDADLLRAPGTSSRSRIDFLMSVLFVSVITAEEKGRFQLKCVAQL